MNPVARLGEALLAPLPLELAGRPPAQWLLAAWISRMGPLLRTVPTAEIYENTLHSGRTLRPWAFDADRFVALEHRRRFVADYIADRERFQPSQSAYYAFLAESKANGFAPPYEGCEAWAYADAEGMCDRYMRLVDIALENLDAYRHVTACRYLDHVTRIHPTLAALERTHPVRVFHFGEQREIVRKESRQYIHDGDGENRSAAVVGHLVPSAVLAKGKCILWNGSHRLAMFRAFEQAGMNTDRFPVFITAVNNTETDAGLADAASAADVPANGRAPRSTA